MSLYASNYTSDQLQQYFSRINYNSSLENIEPTLENLTQIILHHQFAIPFGALDLTYYNKEEFPNGYDININPQMVFNKMVLNSREGKCIEHAILLDGILSKLGFDCFMTAARYVDFWQLKKENKLIFKGRGHCINIISIKNEKYVVDAGIGSSSCRTPVPIYNPDPKITTHRIVQSDLGLGFTSFIFQKQDPDTKEFGPLFSFDLTRYTIPDLEPINYYSNHNSNSIFVQVLMLNQLTPTGTIDLINKRLTIKSNDEVTVEYIETEAQRREMFNKVFKINLPPNEPEHLPLKMNLF